MTHYLLSAFAYQWMTWYIPPLIPYSTINTILMSVSNSNFTSVSFKAACHANPAAEKGLAGSNS